MSLIKKPSLKQGALTLVPFLIGLVLSFVYQQIVINAQTEEIKSFVTDSRELFNAEHALASSCFEAYRLLNECTLEKPESCDQDQVTYRIQEQTKVRDEAINYISNISEEIEQTIARNNW